MLEIKNVSKTYKTSKDTPVVNALSDINITFPKSGLVFIVGKSGSGKSTLLNVIGGLESPSSGEIIINGTSSKDFSPVDFDNYRNSFIGFIFQEYNLINEFSVYDNISFALELQGKKREKETVNSLLEKLDLIGFENRRPLSLSGGEKQRVAIARALAKNPKVILADEPSGSLDSKTGENVFNILKKISEEKLVIVVSHDMEFANKYADRIIELKDGKILEDKTINSGNSDEPKDESVLTKSKLPLLKCIKIGLNGIKKRKVKFIISILLTGIALSFFGAISTVLFFDAVPALTEAANKLKIDSEFISKKAILDNTYMEYDYPKQKESRSIKETLHSPAGISKNEIASLNANTRYGHKFAGVYSKDSYPFFIEDNGDYINPIYNKMYSCSFFSGFTDCGHDYLVKNSMPLLAGAYPTKTDNIAISRYHADLLINYYALNNNVTYTYTDLINQPIKIDFKNGNINVNDSDFYISGIYDTGEIDTYYKEKFENTSISVSTDFFESYTEYLKNSYKCLGYVCSDFYDKYKSLFKIDYSFDLTNSVTFESVNFTYSASNYDDQQDHRVDLILPKFNDFSGLSFYDKDCKKINYVEPKLNQIYLNKKYLEYEPTKNLYNSLISCLQLIEEIRPKDGKNRLPEADSYFADKTNLNAFYESLNYLKAAFTGDNIFDSFNPTVKENIENVINLFYETAFKRYYIVSLLNDMTALNEIGKFGLSYLNDKTEDPNFYNRYIKKILYSYEPVEAELYEQCYNEILNNETLSKFALRALHIREYRAYIYPSTDDLYFKLDEQINNGNGKEILEEDWNDFNDAFVNTYLENISEGYWNYFSKSNLISLNYEHDKPSYEVEITYPSEIYYYNSFGNSGKLQVIGYFSFNTASVYSHDDVYIMNEEFINDIASSPDLLYVNISTTSYKVSDDEIYNYVITKSNFSKDEVRELTQKGEGYQYFFNNKEFSSVYKIDLVLFQFYFCTILGSLIFGLFGALLLGNFISSSIFDKRKEIGIIRSLGGRNVDIYKIFASESLATSILSTLVATIFSIITAYVANSIICHYTKYTILHFGFLNFLCVLGVSLVFSLLATVIPILKTRKLSPSEIIRHE